MSEQVSITVDGRPMQVEKGTLLWEACKAHGIDIPIFCYHTKLGPVGACRTCLVEVEGMPKGPVTACSTPVTDGMVVRTRSPVVEKAQRGIFEFLLLNHPLDCPICDRGGECPLQDQTFAYGPGFSRYIEPKRHHVKPIALGPTIALDRERCVLCWRCVRFCDEIAEDKSIILLDRGDHSMVGTFQDEPYVSNFSGNVIELCPVGALTSRKQRFNFRPWELRNHPSVCPHCPMGCNINISVRKSDEVIRFLSRDNPEVDDSWLCDRGRFGFEFINSSERLRSPLVRRGDAFVETSWGEALGYVAQRTREVIEIHGATAVAAMASPRLTNEDLWVFKRFMRETIGSSKVDHSPRSPVLGLDAARRLDERVGSIAHLARGGTILLVGADPSEREPVMELRIRLAVNRHGARLVTVSSDEVPLQSKARTSVRYPAGRFVPWVRALTDLLQGGSGNNEGLPQLDIAKLCDLANQGLVDAPFTLMYDDRFADAEDKVGALQAVSALADALASKGETQVIPMLDDCNSMGARDLRILPDGLPLGASDPIAPLLAPGSPVRAAFLMGVDMRNGLGRRPDHLELLVVSELVLTATAAQADVVLPAASFAEKRGTFTNTERRVQMIYPAVPSPGIARSDWETLVDLSQYFEIPLDYSSPEEIWDDIRRSVRAYESLSYDDLGASGARPAVLQAV